MDQMVDLPVDADSLCYNIVEQNVIPILGNEIFECTGFGEQNTIEAWYAAQLKNRYSVDDPALDTLTATVEYLVSEKRVRLQDIRIYLKTIDFEASVHTFPLIQKLLHIDAFQLYINTNTYGYILKQLIDAAKDKETHVENFAIMEKLGECEVANRDRPFLLNLFGSLKTSMTPALLEEEMLECVNLFIERKNTEPLKQVMDALSSKTLLFIGCSQPVWLTRFLFRNISNVRLLDWDPDRRGGDIIIVNNPSPERDDLFRFLRNNNAKTYDGNIAAFLSQLSNAWDSYTKRNPPKPKQIFISYSHKDVEAARRLCESLSQVKNVKCWFDEKNLQAGNNFKRGITDGISTADLFIPLLSKNSIQPSEVSLVTVKGEWGQAYNINSNLVKKNQGKDVNYLMPVAIDDVDLGSPVIQEFFENLSIATVAGGNADDRFICTVKQKLNIA